MEDAMPHDRPPHLSADISTVTERLRLIRTVSQARRYHGRPVPQLPSKPAIAALVADLVGLLYPRHFGPDGLTPETTDAYVARTLASVLPRLAAQAQLELLLSETTSARDAQDRATAIAAEFAQTLPRLRDLHDTDIAAAYDGDPSAKSRDEIIFCFPGIAAILWHRIAHELYRVDLPMLARIVAELSHSRTAIDIHPGARIGPAFFIDHGTGVVIGETAIIGRNVRIYQNVTLGAKRFEEDENGVLIKGRARHPIIEDDVVIYAGATILGRITVGRASTIGGGVWLTHAVPPGSLVTQAKPQLDVAVDQGGTY